MYTSYMFYIQTINGCVAKKRYGIHLSIKEIKSERDHLMSMSEVDGVKITHIRSSFASGSDVVEEVVLDLAGSFVDEREIGQFDETGEEQEG